MGLIHVRSIQYMLLPLMPLFCLLLPVCSCRCSECSGSGEVKCETCQCAGRLKKFRELTITWLVRNNHRYRYM